MKRSKIARPNTEINNAWMDMEMAETMEELVTARDRAMAGIAKWPEREWKVRECKLAVTVDCYEFMVKQIEGEAK